MIRLSALVAAVVLAGCAEAAPRKATVAPGTGWVVNSRAPRVLTFTGDPVVIELRDVDDGADVSVSIEWEGGHAGACASAQNVSAFADTKGVAPTNAQIAATLDDTLSSFERLCSIEVGALRAASQRELKAL